MGMLSVFKTAPKAAIKMLNKTGFALKKARPQILVFGGMAAAGVAFIWMACSARKIDQTIIEGNEKVDEAQKKVNDISEAVNLADDEKKQKLKEAEKELNKAKAESVWKMFLLIGPPSITFLGGMAMTVGGHIELFKRFGQVSALLAATQESFRRYRAQNIAEHGEECDRRYIYGITGEKMLRLRFLGVLAFSFSASGFSSFALRLRLGFSEGMACMDSASMMLYINSVLSLDETAFRLFAKAFSSSKLICSSSIFV